MRPYPTVVSQSVAASCCFLFSLGKFYTAFTGTAVSISDFFDIELLQHFIVYNIPQLLKDCSNLLVCLDSSVVFQKVCSAAELSDEKVSQLLGGTNEITGK